MSAHLVETSEEDSFLAVARFIGDLLNEGQERTALADTPGSVFTRKCEALLVDGSYGELLNEFAAQVDLLLKKVTDKASLDCCLDVLVHVTPRLPEEDWPAAAAKVSAALTAEVDKQAERRVLALTDLFNVLPEPRVRYRLLMDTLAYAKKASLAGLIGPTVKAHVETWAKEWELSTGEERALYLAAAEVMRASKKKRAGPADGYRLTLKALASFEGASAAELAGVRDAAAGCAAEFVRFPDQFQFDLLESEPLAQLQRDPEHVQLYRLLTILLTSADVREYEAFARQHSEVLTSIGITPEAALAKARMLALLSLASRSNELSYAAIKEALDLEEGQEEAWVIRSIGLKLLEARIDQMRRSVTVTKLTQRAFTSAQWADLRAQLAAWKENVWSVKDLVGSHKEDGLSRGVPAAPVALRA